LPAALEIRAAGSKRFRAGLGGFAAPESAETAGRRGRHGADRSEVLLEELPQLPEGLAGGLRLVVQVVVAGALDDEQVLLRGAGPVEEFEAVAVGAERARDVADDDLQRLGQQLLRQVEGVEAERRGEAGEEQPVRRAGVLPA